jgi:hypothetical protein
MTPRNLLIARGRKRAERSVGPTLRWPGTSGTVYPITAAPLTNSRRLNDNGGGFQLFDDGVAVIRAEHFTADARPEEQDTADLSVGAGEPYRAMRITAVDVNPGAGTLILHLNSIAQGS